MANLIDIITQETRLRNYSPKTTKAYTSVARDLFAHFKRSLREVTHEEILQYLLKKQESGLSSQTISLHANAINFIYRELYKDANFEKIRHPKRTQKLPIVLSRKEIKYIINGIKNVKHRLIVALAYGAGLLAPA